MFKWPSFRFSLLSLMLVLTIVGIATSHWLTSRELVLARSTVREQRDKIRDLSHSLGILVEEDLEHVQVRCIRFDGKAGPSDNPFHVEWQIHLPQDETWKLKWAVGKIPMKGFPTEPIEGRKLDGGGAEWCRLKFAHIEHRLLGRGIELECSAFELPREWIRYAPSDDSYWLEPNVPTSITCAAPIHHYSGHNDIVQFSGDEPIVLYRERLQNVLEVNGLSQPVDDPEPCAGMMIWLERVNSNSSPQVGNPQPLPTAPVPGTE